MNAINPIYKAKKGDKVYLITTWNDCTTKVREMVVESWGAKRITLSHIENGEMLKNFVYTETLNNSDASSYSCPHILNIGVGLDAAKEYALSRAEQIKEFKITDYNNKIKNSKNQKYINAMIEKRDALEPLELTVIAM